jgi:N-acetylmuramoyl-L-alanine amidase
MRRVAWAVPVLAIVLFACTIGSAGQAVGQPDATPHAGVNGIQPRDDLAGINLSTVPKVFIECANMRNAADAALVTSLRWQALAARAIAAGLASFLVGLH